MNIISTRRLPAAQYLETEYEKTGIVLHFTAGATAGGALDWWKVTPERVAAPYVISARGEVFEAYPDKCWAFHLGVKGHSNLDKHTIAIEIVNVGPLQHSNSIAAGQGKLCWWPENFSKPYCDVTSTYMYTLLPGRGWRGFQYFANYTPEQYASVNELLRHICSQHGINRECVPATKRLLTDLAFMSTFKGISAHSNFRKDKTDVGPAFDWVKLVL